MKINAIKSGGGVSYCSGGHMKLNEFLKKDYQKKALRLPKNCLTFDEIYNYANRNLPQKDKMRTESHLAECYHCLDTLTAIYKGAKALGNKRRLNLKREYMYLILAILCFASSFVFSRYFLQFLAATLILGMKWIVDSKTNRILIMIYDAYKRGGEREAGRVLKEMGRR